MPAYYSVVQYVPDLVADERVNLGVVVFGEGSIRSRFIHQWDWVEGFGNDDISYLREFVQRITDVSVGERRQITQTSFSQLPGRSKITEDLLRRMIDESSGLIQFTPAQASLEDPESLVERLAATMLRSRRRRTPAYRDHSHALRLAVNSARDAVARRLGRNVAEHSVRSPYAISSQLYPLVEVNLGIANGRAYEVAQAISFETSDMSKLKHEVRAALYLLRDIKEAHRDLDLAIIALPPNQDSPHVHEATQQFDDVHRTAPHLGIELVEEQALAKWAEGVATVVEEHLSLTQRRQIAG